MDMDIFHSYIYSTAAWLSVEALPLLVTPKLIIALLSPQVRNATDLEIYFARSLGLSLFTIALITLFFTGIIPFSTQISEPISLNDSDPKAPYARPIIQLTSLFHMVSLIYYYMRFMKTGQTGYVLGMVGAGAMGAMGLWCIMFASEKPRISKRTGADKRTSGFPFSNAEADKKKGGKRL